MKMDSEFCPEGKGMLLKDIRRERKLALWKGPKLVWKTVVPSWCLKPTEMMDVHTMELMGEAREAG